MHVYEVKVENILLMWLAPPYRITIRTKKKTLESYTYACIRTHRYIIELDTQLNLWKHKQRRQIYEREVKYLRKSHGSAK